MVLTLLHQPIETIYALALWKTDGILGCQKTTSIVGEEKEEANKMVINAMWFDEDGELKEKLIDLEDLKLFGEIEETDE